MSTHLTPSVEIPNGTSLVAQMRPALVKYFKRKTGSAVEAEDLAQDVLMRALTHADWKTQAQAKGYIFRSAVNRWRDRRRRLQTQGVTVAWDEATAAESGAENPPERVLIDQEDLNRVIAVLQEIDPRARTILMLVKLEQMKIATVAASLGLSVRTVNKDLAKAVARLARLRSSKEFQP